MSAKQEPALKALIGHYATHLEAHSQAGLAEVSAMANLGRAHLKHRLAIVAESTGQLARQLVESEGIQGVAHDDEPPQIVFLFTGQGAQYPGMARELYQTQEVFRQVLQRCNELLLTLLEVPLLDVIFPSSSGGKSDADLLNQTAYTQPALFSVEYALSELWRSWGIEPAAVMGHSVGEYVAACVAGVFSLEDGLRLIATRGALMQALPSGGEMVVVRAGESRVAAAISAVSDQVSIAAINAPEQTVISGACEAVRRVTAELEGEGFRCSLLPVSHAFHSPLMEAILPEFLTVAEQVTYSRPKIPLVSNVTGDTDPNTCISAEYWVRHIRQSVRFMDSLEAVYGQGYRMFLEIGPQPVLSGLGGAILSSQDCTWLPSLRRGRSDWHQILGSLGELYVRGQSVNWASVDAAYVERRAPLPTYPFQRKRFWIKETEGSRDLTSPLTRLPGGSAGHPLLGERVVTGIGNERQVVCV